MFFEKYNILLNILTLINENKIPYPATFMNHFLPNLFYLCSTSLENSDGFLLRPAFCKVGVSWFAGLK